MGRPHISMNFKHLVVTHWKLVALGACVILVVGWLVAHRDPTPQAWRAVKASPQNMQSVEALLGPPPYRSFMGDGQAWGYRPTCCVHTFWVWFDGSGKVSYTAVTSDS